MFKIIKETNWTSPTTGTSGTTLVVAYKGRVFTASKEDFAGIKIDDKAKTVTFGEAIEFVPESYIDAFGEKKTGLRLRPKMDLELAQY